jgi:hypothetical protein
VSPHLSHRAVVANRVASPDKVLLAGDTGLYLARPTQGAGPKGDCREASACECKLARAAGVIQARVEALAKNIIRN